jgi:hypothetical protein
MHPSLHVYLLRYVPNSFEILKLNDIPRVQQNEKAVWIQPVINDMPPGTYIYRGRISGGVGEIAYGLVPIYPQQRVL